MSSFFTIPYIAFLGFILLLILGVYIFLVRKMARQNNQFCSIVGVVTSLADELNAVKFHLNHMNMVGSGMKDMVNPINIPINSSETFNLGENLIDVSDDEDDDNNEDEDDEDFEDVEDNEDDDDDEDDEDEDDDDDDNDNKSNEDDEDIINQLFENKLNLNDIRILNINDLSNQNKSDNEEDEDIDDIDDSDMDDDDFDMIETIDIEDIESEEDDKKVREIPVIEIPVIDIIKNKVVEDINLEKSKNIEVIDYKKLSLNKLNSVVLDKGLTTDPSKMKKNDLLKLLGIE
jgi:hypothetical protein